MRASIIILSILIATSASGQFQVGYYTGYASYSLRSLKSYQDTKKSAFYPEGAIIAQSFPSFWYNGVDAKWSYKRAQVGAAISWGSSGGQIAYTDFSGSLKEQKMLTYTQVSTIIGKTWSFNNSKLIITLDPRISVAFGRPEYNRKSECSGH